MRLLLMYRRGHTRAGEKQLPHYLTAVVAFPFRASIIVRTTTHRSTCTLVLYVGAKTKRSA